MAFLDTAFAAERQPSFGSWLVMATLSSAVLLNEFTTHHPGGFLDEFIHSSIHLFHRYSLSTCDLQADELISDIDMFLDVN